MVVAVVVVIIIIFVLMKYTPVVHFNANILIMSVRLGSRVCAGLVLKWEVLRD